MLRSAPSDIEALRSVLGSNDDGVLDASDAAYVDFKIIVTYADGSMTAEADDSSRFGNEVFRVARAIIS